MKDEMSNVALPFQVENIITSMMNKKDPAHVRYNYRMRLDMMRDVIDKSIKQYDDEMFMNNNQRRSNKKRG